MSRRVLRGLLEDAGFNIEGEVDMAVSALDLVTMTRPDLLVLDVNMPGISGVEIVRDVSERSPQTSVIVVSAFDVGHLDSFDLGVAAVLAKTDLVHFEQVLSEVMAGKDPTSAS